jgi:hypothetical protein
MKEDKNNLLFSCLILIVTLLGSALGPTIEAYAKGEMHSRDTEGAKKEAPTPKGAPACEEKLLKLQEKLLKLQEKRNEFLKKKK